MRELDIPGTAEEIAAFLKRTVSDAGFSRVVVAVSGGIDSAIAVALATAALGPHAVFALFLPYQNWHVESGGRAGRLLTQLQIPASHIREIDIAPMVRAFIRMLGLEPQDGKSSANEEVDKVRLGNIMARVRMIALFDYAKELAALVLGTENKSEHYLGYYTRFGDEASDIEPLRNLYKTEVYQLAGHLGIPIEITEAAPTAGLWPGQSDEGQFGFTYETADKILYGLYEAGRSPDELTEQGLDKNQIGLVQAWVAQMAFKHHLPRIAPEPLILSRSPGGSSRL
jgi:NAD+ synthase